MTGRLPGPYPSALRRVDPQRAHRGVAASRAHLARRERAAGTHPQIARGVEQKRRDGPLIADSCTDEVDALADLEPEYLLGSVVSDIECISNCGNAHRLREVRIIDHSRMAQRVKNRIAVRVKQDDSGRGGIDDEDPHGSILLADCDRRTVQTKAGPKLLCCRGEELELLLRLH